MKCYKFWVRETGSLEMDGKVQEAHCLAGSNISYDDARQAWALRFAR